MVALTTTNGGRVIFMPEHDSTNERQPVYADEATPAPAFRPIPDRAKAVLAELHPDPFVQAAIWKVFQEAPGLLASWWATRLLNATMEPK
jgi:hypothetical protein